MVVCGSAGDAMISVISITLDHSGKSKMVISIRPPWWQRLFGMKTQQHTFVGECTVWHDLATGRRPGTWVEGRLSELEWLHKYDRTGAR